MCDYCNPKMYDREVYYDTTSDIWFLDIETGEWSDYNDDLRCKNEKNEVQLDGYDTDSPFISTYEEIVAYENPC